MFADWDVIMSVGGGGGGDRKEQQGVATNLQ